jgi:hypothetical protein
MLNHLWSSARHIVVIKRTQIYCLWKPPYRTDIPYRTPGIKVHRLHRLFSRLYLVHSWPCQIQVCFECALQYQNYNGILSQIWIILTHLHLVTPQRSPDPLSLRHVFSVMRLPLTINITLHSHRLSSPISSKLIQLWCILMRPHTSTCYLVLFLIIPPLHSQWCHNPAQRSCPQPILLFCISPHSHSHPTQPYPIGPWRRRRTPAYRVRRHTRWLRASCPDGMCAY